MPHAYEWVYLLQKITHNSMHALLYYGINILILRVVVMSFYMRKTDIGIVISYL